VVGIFDNNLAKIGQKLWNLEVQDITHLPEANRVLEATIGLIAVPAEAAQNAADLLVAAGIRAIVNFAPRMVEVPAGVSLRNVDMTRELEILCYYLDQKQPVNDSEIPP
jgi:redox-sensing transcriptional repressor